MLATKQYIALSFVVLIAVHLALVTGSVVSRQNNELSKVLNEKQFKHDNCNLRQKVEQNNLSLNDFSLRNPNTEIVCVKGRFSVAIKLERIVNDNASILGFVELENLESSDGNCETEKIEDNKDLPTTSGLKSEKDNQETTQNPNPIQEPSLLLKMSTYFECGYLQFTFVKDIEQESYYVKSIEGSVSYLDNSTAKFKSKGDQVFFKTSDLKHHFKQQNTTKMIEVVSENNEVDNMRLSAQFYAVEFEVFRTTTNLDSYQLEEDLNPVYIDNASKPTTTTTTTTTAGQ